LETVQGGAEVFVRESASYGFTLKSISNDNFVEIQDNKLRATGAGGVIINIKACGTNPAGFGPLRSNSTADGIQEIIQPECVKRVLSG
jgi:hypothetical protein